MIAVNPPTCPDCGAIAVARRDEYVDPDNPNDIYRKPSTTPVSVVWRCANCEWTTLAEETP